MARKARQKISYVLPLADSAQGHRLGVNGLAIDQANSVLYSGGRDGVIYAWDTHLNLSPTSPSTLPRSRSNSLSLHTSPSTVRQSVQAHTHWINDLTLAQHDQVLVSASSDVTVKLWRPSAHASSQGPQTIGLHSDYVKVLAVPHRASSWVASGGLDKQICLWDLAGAGQISLIDASDHDGLARDKGSVYALAATPSVLAGGGPEGSVHVWDPRSAARITKFVGHAGNIRHILTSQDGTTIVSASTDSTVRVWDLVAKRCLATLTMHDTSVWSLFSNDPSLRTFFSSDKTGLVAKTDTGTPGPYDHPLSVALCQDDLAVSRVVAAGDYVWTASSSPNIKRWLDVDLTNAEPEMPDRDQSQSHGYGSITSRTRMHSFSQPRPPTQYSKRQVPLKHTLPSVSTFHLPHGHSTSSLGRRSTIISQRRESHCSKVEPLRAQPDSSIPGQNGLVKHVMLSNRRQVLTRDAVGQIVLWDLLKCRPIKTYGQRHLEDVATEINVQEYVDNWCSVDINIGALSVTLEDHTCFDAEAYHDEFEFPDTHVVKEDQRINLGKWVLSNLFANLISAEQLRDKVFRHHILHYGRDGNRDRTPLTIQVPSLQYTEWHNHMISPTSPMSPSSMHQARFPVTPGLGINMATPLLPPMPPLAPFDGPPLSPQPDNLQAVQYKDYFSLPNVLQVTGPALQSEVGQESKPATPVEPPKSPLGDELASKFRTRFRANINSTIKKLGRGPSLDKERTENDMHEGSDCKAEPATDDEQRSTGLVAQVSSQNMIEDNMYGTLQMLRLNYEDHIRQALQEAQEQLSKPRLRSLITPPGPPEMPTIHIPNDTTILIQEDRPEAGGVVDLFKGTVATLGDSLEQIEKAAPRWLGDVLLRDEIPVKEYTKVTFVLEPWKQCLPAVAMGENNRLNANRMLRARKILSYVGERIHLAVQSGQAQFAHLSTRPDLALELWCNDNLIPAKMTLATIRTRFWKGGGDVVIHYKVMDSMSGVS